ncbi:class I lanthipeptide [Kordia sp.]|uniref:class I lanthipeptide n=1 Tax=Kordia sp. TaxID=1965332 RepID=UPI003D26CC16
MKKKRSIQKLSFHKEKISTLNTVTGGAKITTTITIGVTIATEIVTNVANCNSYVSECRETCNWMICVVNETDGC